MTKTSTTIIAKIYKSARFNLAAGIPPIKLETIAIILFQNGVMSFVANSIYSHFPISGWQGLCECRSDIQEIRLKNSRSAVGFRDLLLNLLRLSYSYIITYTTCRLIIRNCGTRSSKLRQVLAY